MTRPLRIEYAGAFYHITFLGNKKKTVFKDGQDRINFLTYSCMSISDTSGSQQQIADHLNMHIQQSANLVRGKTWRQNKKT